MSVLEVIQCNHASVLLAMGQVRLLTDPWFEGTVFDGGWALRWSNPSAYDVAATATHLWISHPHSDHLHHATLQRLAGMNPNLIVLANQAYNYDLEKQLRRLGFNNIILLPENECISLSDQCRIERMGTGTIDSLLSIRWHDHTILNLNDCVLQKGALRYLVERIGPIDLLLVNFNHAGKLMHYPEQSGEAVRAGLKQHFARQVDVLQPRCVLPFASFHYYLSPFSQSQNASLLEPADLEPEPHARAKVLPLYPSQRMSLNLGTCESHIAGTPPEPGDRTAPAMSVVTEDEFWQAAASFERRIAGAYGFLRRLLPSLAIQITGTQRIIYIRHGRVTAPDGIIAPDIETSYEKLAHWFGQSFGTDMFFVGAHLRILRPCIGRLKLLAAMLLLAEAKVSPRYWLSPALWGFLFRRRHEAWAALWSGRVSASYQR
jgi:hypothetical protein